MVACFPGSAIMTAATLMVAATV
jgi:hypothetical protein